MTLARALARALPASLAPQDRLDLLAVAAGWKPVALLGVEGAGWPGDLLPALASGGLECEIGPPWRIAGQWDGLPGWYRQGIEEAMQALALLYVTRAETAGACPPPGAAIASADEAQALAYPPCCVVAYHGRQQRLHALCARQIARRTSDPQQRARLARACLPPIPASEDERRELAAATAAVFAPLTPVAQCPDCARASDGPAARLSRRYAMLAAEAGR